jgi:hypothetical protein
LGFIDEFLSARFGPNASNLHGEGIVFWEFFELSVGDIKESCGLHGVCFFKELSV